MLVHKTTAKDLFLRVWPALNELGAQKVNGRAVLDLARNIQNAETAIAPLETTRQKLTKQVAEGEQSENEANDQWNEVLATELEFSYLPLPYAELAGALGSIPAGLVASLLFMIVEEQAHGNS